MILIIKFFALVAIVLFVVVVGRLAFVFRWLRKVAKSGVESSSSCPPCRVNPEAEPAPQWRTPGKVLQYAAEYKALGFDEIGAFTIPEMEGLLMLGFVHPAERLYGIIYDHKKIPPTFDVVCDFEDNSGLSAASSKAGSSLDKRPGHPILWLGDERVSAVLAA